MLKETQDNPEIDQKVYLYITQLIDIKQKFFNNIFNNEFIEESYMYVWENEDMRNNNKNIEFIYEDPVFKQLKGLRNYNPKRIYI